MPTVTEKLSAMTRGTFAPRPEPTTRNTTLPVGEPASMSQLQARRRELETDLDGLAGSGWDGAITSAVARYARAPFHTAADAAALLRGDRLDAIHSTAVEDLQRELRAVTMAIEQLQVAEDQASVRDINRRAGEATDLLRKTVARAYAIPVADLPAHMPAIRRITDLLTDLMLERRGLIRPDATVGLPPLEHDVNLESAALALLFAGEHVAEAEKVLPTKALK